MATRIVQGLMLARTTPKVSRLDFRWRLTLAEQIAIKRAETEHPDADVRAMLAITRESLSDVTEESGVRPDDPRTQDGIDLILSVLVGTEVLAPENVSTRRAELLRRPTAQTAVL